MNCEKTILHLLIVMIALLSLCETRGGRRGGSFGGLFGSWRKYKKPSSGGGSSRRIVSSSPVHTPITKAMHENKKTGGSDKLPKTNNYYNNYNSPPLPTGGSYYQNAATLPGNAIYVAQPPPRGAEIGDFLTGYLTGRLLTMGFSPPYYHHVTHVYKDNPAANDQNANNSAHKVVIVNGQSETTTAEPPYTAPLETTTVTTTTTETITGTRETRSTSTYPPLDNMATSTPAPIPTPYGIICVPMLLDETNEKGEKVQVEKTICYPAPAPPSPQKDLKSNPVEIAGDIIEP